MSRLVTSVVAIALALGLLDATSTPVRHNDIMTLDASLNRIAVIGDSYTTGGDLGGLGSNGWAARAWQLLARQGLPVTANVAAEGGAGYGTRGNHGSVFEDLTADAVKPDDALVVFFGSRNDQWVDPTQLSVLAYGTYQLARRTAPSAKFLVIGPPWPTADPPDTVLRIRDALKYQAGVAGATFIDPIAAGWFVGRPELIGKDGIHPTDAGHAYMAAKIAPLIGAQLARQI
ncbi:Rv0518 family GDSL lipase [Mycobacterium sp.]|uniref:Rv0518 family GDSL lipase n=1 Tax=Mycobacterium sp. TaxID=1785 RepID=UPI002CF87DDD|nr:GDSL lipase [Mycobacterium sp.]HTH88765.1 GDSL lipase [Mycobacterium sp.]